MRHASKNIGRFSRNHFLSPIIFISFFLLSSSTFAASSVGRVVFVKGSPSVSRLESGTKTLQFNNEIFELDTLQTGMGEELKVLLVGKTMLSLSPHSKVLITEHLYRADTGTRKSILSVLKGKVRTIVEQGLPLRVNDMQIQTATAVAGIRGTDVGTSVSGNISQFVCFSGLFDAYFKDNPENKVLVRPGEFTEISGPVPTDPAPAPPELKEEFSANFQETPLEEVVEQAEEDFTPTEEAGIEEAPPPEEAVEEPAPEEEWTAAEEEAWTEAPESEVLPGGEEETPTGASGTSGSQAPVTVPITFPEDG